MKRFALPHGIQPACPIAAKWGLMLALVAGLAPSFAMANTGAMQATCPQPPGQNYGFDTGFDSNCAAIPQYFAVGGALVGTWSPTLFTVNTALSSTSLSTGTLTAGATTVSSLSAGAGSITTTGSLSAGATTVSSLSGGAISGTTVGATTSMTSLAYYHSSDARLKTAIHPIGNALDKLMEIHGVEFNWKKDGRADMGVVAQNVAEVFPNVVARDDKGIMSVEYDSLVGPMIEAIRVLKTENDDLRQKVAAMDDMKAQLTELRESVQKLKHEDTRLQSIKFDKSAGQEKPPILTP